MRGKTNGEICENGWLPLHLQTERGNLSEFNLNCLIKYLYTGEERVRNAFGLWPRLPFISPLGALLPTFYPIFLTLWLSLRFDSGDHVHCIPQVGRNLILGLVVAGRALLLQKQAPLWPGRTCAGHSLISQGLPPRTGVRPIERPDEATGPRGTGGGSFAARCCFYRPWK